MLHELERARLRTSMWTCLEECTPGISPKASRFLQILTELAWGGAQALQGKDSVVDHVSKESCNNIIHPTGSSAMAHSPTLPFVTGQPKFLFWSTECRGSDSMSLLLSLENGSSASTARDACTLGIQLPCNQTQASQGERAPLGEGGPCLPATPTEVPDVWMKLF